jgi:hypothetical protein
LVKNVVDGVALKDVKNQAFINIDLSTIDNGVCFCSIIDDRGNQVIKKFIVAK